MLSELLSISNKEHFSSLGRKESRSLKGNDHRALGARWRGTPFLRLNQFFLLNMVWRIRIVAFSILYRSAVLSLRSLAEIDHLGAVRSFD